LIKGSTGMLSITDDYNNDLAHSRTTPLLIEVQKKHLEQLKKENEHFSEAACFRKYYDQGLADTRMTNVIIIDTVKGNASQIFTVLYHLLADSFRNKLNIEAALKLGVFCLTAGFSEMVSDSINDDLMNHIDDVKDKISGLSNDTVGEYVAEKPLSSLSDSLEDGGKSMAENVNGSHQLGSELYLSKKAQEGLLALATNMSEKHTAHQGMQFTIELITTLCIDAPKLIVINNPFDLDSASLSLCSLLFSYAKDAKQKGESTDLSFVFNYTKQQPFETPESSEAHADVFARLSRLRHMVQRYGMLEKPGASIPKPVVRASTFVGREDELKQLHTDHCAFIDRCVAQKSATNSSQWTLVKGEPGTGKTALVHRHLDIITKPAETLISSQIRLRIFNQVGHNSQQTGLASLMQSIHTEALRLTKAYQANQSFVTNFVDVTGEKIRVKNAKEDTKQAIKNRKISLNNINKAFKFISGCLNLGSIYEAGTSVYGSMTLDASYRQTSDAIGADNQVDDKQDQFDQLIKAIKYLSNISAEVDDNARKMPMLLFIDDMQWIDELSSEFILTRLLKECSVQALVTARRSDSETSYKLASKEAQHSPYKIQLFDAIKLCSSHTMPVAQNDVQDNGTEHQNHDIKLTAPITIEGMDKSTLTTLLTRVYQKTELEHAEVLAIALINALTEGEAVEETQVVTLFAIEALNVISDEGFYRRNSEVPRLITRSEKGEYAINAALQDRFGDTVARIFSLLHKTHQDAFNHDSLQDDSTSPFTLSSYAVMEERLYIIREYFAEYGDAATFSLQLSALLGAPFDSELIKELVVKLRMVDLKQHKELAPLKEYLEKQKGTYLTPEHLELLDEVFAILRRQFSTQSMHQYRHELFAVFLQQQAKYFLNQLFKYKEELNAINSFISICITEINNWFSSQASSELSSREVFEKKLYKQIAEGALLEFAYSIDKSTWAECFTKNSITLGNLLVRANKNAESIIISETANFILEGLSKNDPKKWTLLYAKSLNQLAFSYASEPGWDWGIYKKSRINPHQGNRVIDLYHKSAELLSSSHIFNSDPCCAKVYLDTLESLVLRYKQAGNKPLSIAIEKTRHRTVTSLYQNDKRWSRSYSLSLVRMTDYFLEKKVGCKALECAKMSHDITSVNYLSDQNYWGKAYSESLEALIKCNLSLELFEDAKNHAMELRLILKRLVYKINEKDRLENELSLDYLRSFNYLSDTYMKSSLVKEGLNILEEQLHVIEAYLPSRWDHKYFVSVRSLCEKASGKDKIRLQEKYVTRVNSLYAANQSEFVTLYVELLNDLSSLYIQADMLTQAINVTSEILHMTGKHRKTLHEELWSIKNASALVERCLRNLAFCFDGIGQYEQAVRVLNELRALTKNSNLDNYSYYTVQILINFQRLKKYQQLDKLANDYLTEIMQNFSEANDPDNIAYLYGVWGDSYHERGAVSEAKDKVTKMEQLILENQLEGFDSWYELIKIYSHEV
jgi:hypothetical protein